MNTTTALSIAAVDRGTWRAYLRKYLAIARINTQNSLAYAWNAMSQGIFAVMFIFVFSQLWTATFREQGVDAIAGLILSQTVWYYVWAELVQLSKINPTLTIQEEVKDGSLAYTLGRPYNYVLYHFFAGLGGVLIRMVAVLFFGSIVAFITVGPLHSFRPETMPLVLLVTCLAFVVDYCIMASIGLLAFFFEDTAAFRLIYSKTVFILGGLMLPVDFLPEGVQLVARLLPFNLVVYAPAKLFVAWDTQQFFQIVGLQIVWIVVLSLLLWQFYRYGARRVSINGG
jgi:ABC-2 type transport system permease protein